MGEAGAEIGAFTASGEGQDQWIDVCTFLLTDNTGDLSAPISSPRCIHFNHINVQPSVFSLNTSVCFTSSQVLATPEFSAALLCLLCYLS